MKCKVDFSLYLITDRRIFSGSREGCETEALLNAIRAALDGGVKAVQLREKDLDGRAILKLAIEVRKLTSAYGALFFINDRVDIALLSGADGVHLGVNSAGVAEARKLLNTSGFTNKDMFIGASTHSMEEALRAERDGADFITFGPVFYTASKASYGEPVGIANLKEVAQKVNLPVFALGGIKAGNVSEVMAVGASGVGLISAILAFDDVEASARTLIEKINIR